MWKSGVYDIQVEFPEILTMDINGKTFKKVDWWQFISVDKKIIVTSFCIII